MTPVIAGPANAGPLSLLKRLTTALDRVSYGIIVVVMGLMTLLVATQVFWRYILGSSIDSADELSRLFFIWAMFMAIPHGIKIGIHVSVDILVKRFGPAMQEVLFRAMALSSIILMAVVFYATIFVTADKWQEMMPTIDVTAAVFYIPILLATGHSVLHLLVLAVGGSRAWEESRP